MNVRNLVTYNPYNGSIIGAGVHRRVEMWRQGGSDPWLFNPWNGQKREQDDVTKDPHGILIEMPGDENTPAPTQAPPPAFLNAVATNDAVNLRDVREARVVGELPPLTPAEERSILFAGPEPETFTPEGDPQYGMLYKVLMEAFAQASTGKGKERHANDLAFTDQKIFSINRQLGSVDGILYQVVKKTIESKKLPPERACAELMGAIVYAAAGILFIRERSL